MKKRIMLICIALCVFLNFPLNTLDLVEAKINLSNPSSVGNSTLDSGKEVTWDCIYFGSYPQKEIKKNTDKYKKLESSSEWKENEIILDEVKYRRMTSDDSVDHTLSNGYDWGENDLEYHYFQYEPIKWRVLKVDGNTAFLLSDQVIDTFRYNTENYSGYTWETSDIRSWLNGYDDKSNLGNVNYTGKGLMDFAFTKDEQASVLSTTVINNDNLCHGTDGGNDTVDKIYLLSDEEVYGKDASTYGFSVKYDDVQSNMNIDDEAKRATCTTYAFARGCERSTSTYYKGYVDWWCRTVGKEDRCAVSVMERGNGWDEQYKSADYGVRPVIKIDISLASYTYAGTVSSEETRIKYSEDTKKEFTIGTDNNQYEHTHTAFKNEFYLDEECEAKIKKLASKENKWAEINEQINEYQGEKWNGVCYGVTSSIGLTFMDEIDISDICGTEGYYDAGKVEDNRKLKSIIDYCFLLKDLNASSKSIIDSWNEYGGHTIQGYITKLFRDYLYPQSSLADFLDSIIEETKAGKPLMLNYIYGKGLSSEGHSILILNCSYDQNKEEYVAEIYDCNSVDYEKNPKGNISKLVFPKDLSSFEMSVANGKTYNDGTVEKMQLVSLEKIPYENPYATGTSRERELSMQAVSSENSDNIQLEFPVDSVMRIENAEGQYMEYSSEKVESTILEEDAYTIYDEMPRWHISVPKTSKLTIIPKTEDTYVKVACNGEICSFSGENITKAFVDLNKGITFQGKDMFDFKTYISLDNNKNCNEDTLMKVAGKGTEQVIIEKDADRVKVQSEKDMQNVEINSLDGMRNELLVKDDVVKKIDIQVDSEGKQQEEKPTETAPVKVSSISVSGISSKIAAGKKVQLSAKVLPENAANKKVVWKSSNTKVATVNGNGRVTVKKKTGGKKVIITATATDGSGKNSSYKLTSMKGVVKKIKLSKVKSLKAGKSVTVNAKISSSKGANKKLKWISSNTKYATVSAKGKVKAKKNGKGKKVKITAMAMDGSNKKASVTIKIK